MSANERNDSDELPLRVPGACKHEKVYSGEKMCSGIPQWAWICAKCKETGVDLQKDPPLADRERYLTLFAEIDPDGANTMRRMYKVGPLAGPRTLTLEPPPGQTFSIARNPTAEGPVTVLGATEPVVLQHGERATFALAWVREPEPETSPAARRRRIEHDLAACEPATDPQPNVSRVSGSSEPTRVFRFRDDAWRCPKGVAVCRIPGATTPQGFDLCVRLNGHEAEQTLGNPFTEAPQATRISTWAEWFDSVVRKAAHEYLDAAMAASREYMSAGKRLATVTDDVLLREVHGPLLYATCTLDCALLAIQRAYTFEEWPALPPLPDKLEAAFPEYVARVRADIEARLRGEPGEVVRP